MKKKAIFVMLALLSLSLVSAHWTYHDVNEGYTYKEKIVESKYYPEEYQIYSRTTYINYDNDKRYSTDVYKYGYSHRTTIDYRDKYPPEKRDYKTSHFDYRDYRRDLKDYYEYACHLREYQKKECYHTAPRNKLFYIRCP